MLSRSNDKIACDWRQWRRKNLFPVAVFRRQFHTDASRYHRNRFQNQNHRSRLQANKTTNRKF